MNKKLSFGPKLSKDARGVVLITSLIIFLILTFVTLSLADLAITQYSRTVKNVSVSNSLLTAEAGVEQSLYSINQSSNFAGFAETEFFNDATQGRGTYQTTVTAGTGANEKIITGIGRVYKHNQSTNPISERQVKVTVVGTTSNGYSVYTGPGGLILNGSASITNSAVYVNGNITLNGASNIGTPAQPLTVNVAHISCPTGTNPGPTYPTQCTTGQPISMAHSTRIYGTVCATNQTSTGPNNNIQAGSSGQGLLPNCTAPAVSAPTYDRAAHIAAMTTVGSANNATYNCSQYQNPIGFTRTWPANLRLNGNVNAASSCDLTITGDVYITGNLDIGGAARIRVANSVGTDRPVVVVDGEIDVGGSAALIPNSSGTGVHFISYKSSATCSPNCASVTGTDLKTSSNLTTIDVSGAGNFPGALFHAYWSKVVMGGSGTSGAAIGQTVELSGAGTITFGTSLSSGASTWTARSYQQIFD